MPAASTSTQPPLPEKSFSRQNGIPFGTAFYKAAVEGDFQVFERYKPSFDHLVTSEKDTVLHIHLSPMDSGRSADFVRKVFDKSPQLIKQKNNNGDTPLHIAARSGHQDMVKLLIQLAKTGDIESGDEARKLMRMVNKDKDTALHLAARWDSVDVVKEILREEDVEYAYSANNSGETPLYLAARFRCYRSLDAILEACSFKPVGYEGPNGKTILHAAMTFGHPDITRRMIENMGSLVNLADDDGWTPLHYAVCFPGSLDFVSWILSKDRSSAYMKDNDRKRTPLHIAACLGNIDAMEIIISQCPDCAQLTDYKGWNVCHFASICSTRALQLILEKSSQAHLGRCTDTRGYSPIELYFYTTFASRNDEWNLGMYTELYERLRNEMPHEISKKKEEMGEWTKELGNGPSGKIVPGAYAHNVTSSIEEIFSTVRVSNERSSRNEIVNRAHVHNSTRSRENTIPELEKAKDSHLVAAALVATVTFAAAFTMPGGYVSDKDNSNNLELGSPILSRNAAFKAFVIADGIAMALSISSVFIHFIMVLLGYKRKYYWLIKSAFWFIVIAMAAMVVAFVTGTYAVLAPNSFGLALITSLIGLTFFVYVLYAVIRLINGIELDTPVDSVSDLSHKSICNCDGCMLFAACCWCIWCPIFGLVHLIKRAFKSRQQ